MNSETGAISRILRIVALGGAMRIDPDVVGRHQPAGRILGVLDQLAQLVGRVVVHLGEQLATAVLRAARREDRRRRRRPSPR